MSPQDRDDLDYGASADQPDIGKTGCGYRFLTPLQADADLIKSQEEADLNHRDWVFDDPQQVASDAIARVANIDAKSSTRLNQKKQTQGRIVYEWSPTGNTENYMVVVSRPYWLSFYAHDPRRVAWVVIAAYVSSCGNDNAVTRIR